MNRTVKKKFTESRGLAVAGLMWVLHASACARLGSTPEAADNDPYIDTLRQRIQHKRLVVSQPAGEFIVGRS